MSQKPKNPIQKLLERKQAEQQKKRDIPGGEDLTKQYKPASGNPGLGPNWGGRNGNGKPS